MLLWHGSRLSNFVGILSQGLRIAPPEAPASGYLFGKGIYLADMSEKSIHYCRSHGSDTALILLIEVIFYLIPGSNWRSKRTCAIILQCKVVDGAKQETLNKVSWIKSSSRIILRQGERRDCSKGKACSNRIWILYGP